MKQAIFQDAMANLTYIHQNDSKALNLMENNTNVLLVWNTLKIDCIVLRNGRDLISTLRTTCDYYRIMGEMQITFDLHRPICKSWRRTI